MKYIFVEGNDDSYFINNLIKNKIDVKIIEYAQKKKEKINGFIKTIKDMHEEYVLLADLDGKDEHVRREELIQKYNNLDPQKIYFSIQEIESWYLSGISDNFIDKYGVKSRILLNTQNVTKEMFERLFKHNKETIMEVKLNLITEFDVEKAKIRNNSFNQFIEDCIWLFS